MPEIYSLVLSEKSGSICIFFMSKLKRRKFYLYKTAVNLLTEGLIWLLCCPAFWLRM